MKINSGMTFTLSTSQIERANALMTSRPGKTPNEMISQIIEQGLYQLTYRGKQNKKNAELKRIGRATLAAVNNVDNVKSARALAQAVGIAIEESDEIIES